MSLADTCTIQAFPVFNGKTIDESSLSSKNMLDLSKEDIVNSTIDTIIENVVSRDQEKNTPSITESQIQGPPESIVVEDLEETKTDIRIENSTLPTEKVIVKNKLKKKVKRLSRKQLEKYISEKTQELIKAQTEVGKLQTTCHTLKKEVKEWKDKSDNLAKSCSNLAKLVKLNLEGNQTRAQPKKQVRSVGIQVKITTLPTKTGTTIIKTGTKRSLDDKEESCPKKPLTTQQHVTTQKHLTTQKPLTTQQQVTTQQKVTTLQKVTLEQKVTPQKEVTSDEDEISIVKQVARLPPLPRSVDVQSGSPPKPNLKLTQTTAGLEVYWTYQGGFSHTQISSYELYAHQDTSKPVAAASWKKVGDIKSIPLPIRCTLSHFKSGSTYFFVVRAKDLKGQFGKFSDVQKICLK
eukprot:TRINITY_DN12129_c0_g1_i1.p1 TRINITY_DN12129_c0_g1~~TRINITY_DN12129_c0_g1_i1.p1  ORF type:complete len:406 (-),score=70.11 TRINITY_DN12129_c0_g1_i1:538-1755(-)